MSDEKEKSTCTVFKLSSQLHKKAKEEAKDKNMSVSEMLSIKLEDLLNSDPRPKIKKSEKGDLIGSKPTSVLLPSRTLTAVNYLAVDNHVSLADIFRHCLEN